MKQRTLGFWAVALLVSSAWASPAQEEALRVPQQRTLSLGHFEAWSAQHGPGWVIDLEPHTGLAGFLGGGRFEPPRVVPRDEVQLERLARRALLEAQPMTGIDVRSLRFERAKYLPLGLIDSTDKWSVAFHQEYAGLAVLGGRVNVLLALDGAVLSIQTTALARLEELDVQPLLAADRARALALSAFEDELGLRGEVLAEPRLAIGSALVNHEREARLVWELELRWSARGVRPEGRRYWIDARSGETLRAAPTVHELDVGGTVTTFATPGSAPDTPANPPLVVPVKDLRVKSPAGNVFTDAAGNFNIVGASGPLQVTAEFVGRWAHVDNDSGPEEALTQQLSGANNALLLNPTPAEAITSQANAFLSIGRLRDWIRVVDPTDDTADFQAYARVNIASVCNAYFDGFSVNFFSSGVSGGTTCVNTGYSTVVAHEMGHWFNVLYNTGNGSDGMGEGNADVYSMYLEDTPLVGEGFFGPGSNVRTGLNTVQFCGDCCPGCHGGQVHLEGQPWMGAAWKIRARLNATNGNALGDLIADGLFSGWMNAYDQTTIRSVIELQWLTLDDDNGDLDDGTPHLADIDGGFRDQGFPGFDLPAILFRDVTQLADTIDEAGPYPIQATVTPQTSPGINAVALHFRVNGGGWQVFGMVPFGGDLYQVDLPGQTSIAFVEYYLSAIDANAVQVQFPEAGPADPFRFVVGSVNVLFFDDFEGEGDNGWTHGSFGDTANAHDDFQRGPPAGRAGDPSTAASGLNIWGNDLGQGVWNGAYQNGQHNWLRAPVIDCSSATNTQLRFQRWLEVDAGFNDVARVRVNGVEVFANDASQATHSTAWQAVTLDISAQADGQPAVVVEFSLESDASFTFGGWSLDDVELRYLTPSPVAVGTPYCFGDGGGAACPCNNNGVAGEGCANSSGAGATLSGSGSASLQSDDLVLHAGGLLAGQPALLFAGSNAVAGGAGLAFGDGLRCAGGAIVRIGVRIPSAGGEAQWGPGLSASGGWIAGDTRRFQVWYRDPVASPCASNFNLTSGLEVSFVP